MNYSYSVGNRVLWLNPETQQEVKGTITRLWKTKAEITDRNLEKHKVELSDLELVPIKPNRPLPPTPHPLPPIEAGDRSEFRGQSETETQSERTLNDTDCKHALYLLWRDDHFANYCWRCHKESVPPVSELKIKMDSLLHTQMSVEEKMRERGDSDRDIAEASFMYEEQIDWIREQFRKLGDIDLAEKSKEPELCTLNEKRSPEPVTSEQPSVTSSPVAVKKAGKLTREEQEEIAEEIAKTRGVHYEWKMIKEHGAYLYVRWWEDGKHKSTTLNSYLKKYANH